MVTSSNVGGGDSATIGRSNDCTSICSDLMQMARGWQFRIHRRRELKQLLQIGPHLLSDIGLDPDELRRQSIKPFWEL